MAFRFFASKSINVATIALTAATLIPAAPARADDPYTEVDLDSWWDCAWTAVSLNLVCPIPAGGDRLYGPYFVQATSPMSQTARCCELHQYTITAGTEIEVKGDVNITICGDTKVGVSVRQTLRTATETTYPPFPCGCMVLTGQQNFCVYVSEYHMNYCNMWWGQVGNTHRWWKKTIVPAGAPTIAPVYYANPSRCNCPTNATYNSPNPQAQQPAPTIAPLPTQIQRPWNTGTDGTPANPDGTWPTQGQPLPGPTSGTEFHVDLAGDFDDRDIHSALDLNLFECRVLVGALNDELRQTGLHVGPDTAAIVFVNKDVKLSGSISKIIKELRNFASDRVHSKRYGDFDGDGERSAADLTLLQEAVTDTSPSMSKRRLYDVDGDDQLTANDVTAWVALNSH